MAGRRRRGGSDGDGAASGPNLSDRSPAGMARNRRLILGFMYGYYDEALDSLPPALAPRLLDAGVCFGFADPVTNIIANTLSFRPDENGQPAPAPDGATIRKRKRGARGRREEILSEIVAGDDVPSPPAARAIAERSLEGLVTFLTSYFRYLPTWDALRYLSLSRADLLVAVRRIELDRCHRRDDKFRIHSHAVAALKCAALAAGLPNVDAFLTGSSALMSHLAGDAPAAENFRRRRRLSVHELTGLLEKPPKPKKTNILMRLAAIRCQQYDMKISPALTESIRGVLLDRIHAVYLEAISRMPIEDFRSRYHQGFLKAGYCYGPFSPLLNIIINTFWYGTVFPASQALEVDMICTRIFIRVVSRSLDGLINLLLACISGLSEHDAMIYLLKSNLELSRAIQMAREDGHDTSSWDATAYKAAADASSHPETEAYLHFVMESLPAVESSVTELLTTQPLSSSKIRHLCTLLSSSRSHPYKSLEPTDELTEDARKMVSSYKEKFFSQQNFVRKKVEATLLNYAQTKEQYELRFICTVNESVGSKSFRDLKYPYSHVNFLASPKDESCITLFFAQISNHDEDSEHHWSFCCPMSNFLTDGTRIVHQVESHSYSGGVMDFEKMATGRHTITNARIISHGELTTCPVGIFGEEYIYFDPATDAKFIRAMNQTAWDANLNWGDEIRRIKQTEA